MKRFQIGLALLLSAILTGRIPAQTKEIQDAVDAKLATARVERQVDEDIEVFRRLLNRGLTAGREFRMWAGNCPTMAHAGEPLYYSARGYNETNFFLTTTGKSVSKSGEKHASPTVAEGVYLPGRGVVFTATLPTPPENPLAPSAKPDDKPMSDWERERQELRGEKAEKPTMAEVKPPSLSETILQLLADNGKHFTKVAPDEQVTVAVVFRPGMLTASQECVACHQATGQGKGVTSPNTYTGSTKLTDTTGRTLTLSGGTLTTTFDSSAVASTSTNPDKTEFGAAFRNELALADLHLKQGKPRDAAMAYQRLIEKCQDILSLLRESPPEKTKSARLYWVMMGMELRNKLAQAQIADGDSEAAVKTLQQVAVFSKNLEAIGSAPKKVTTAASAPPSLPAKLVISASKKVLDQVGVGKMSFDEFRKAATITFTDTEKETGAKP